MGEEKLPLELQLGLRQGSVFYFQSRTLTSPEPHYFIVVNRDPLTSRLLLLTIVTSKVEKVRLRNRERPETVVEISPTEYDEFRVQSAIDANVIVEKPVSELIDLIRLKQIRYHKDIPQPVLSRICEAVHKSPVVTLEIKQQV